LEGDRLGSLGSDGIWILTWDMTPGARPQLARMGAYLIWKLAPHGKSDIQWPRESQAPVRFMASLGPSAMSFSLVVAALFLNLAADLLFFVMLGPPWICFASIQTHSGSVRAEYYFLSVCWGLESSR